MFVELGGVMVGGHWSARAPACAAEAQTSGCPSEAPRQTIWQTMAGLFVIDRTGFSVRTERSSPHVPSRPAGSYVAPVGGILGEGVDMDPGLSPEVNLSHFTLLEIFKARRWQLDVQACIWISHAHTKRKFHEMLKREALVVL